MQEGSFPKIVLAKGKERSLLNKHPWLFSGAVHRIERECTEGDIVEIYNSTGNYIATGHYHEGSIKVRIFSFEKTKAGKTFWDQKIKSAFDVRKQLGFLNNENTNCYRLIHGEGDGMPGLIVDVYYDTVVMQAHSAGMYQLRNIIADSIIKHSNGDIKNVYNKSAESMAKQGIAEIQNDFLKGNAEEVIVKENGIKFHVDFLSGQKTGFFLDQRENRKLLSEYSKGKKVLNTFAYSGGFSLYALKNNASLVHSVDSSKRAEVWYQKNLELNFNKPINEKFFTQDTFDFFKQSDEKYEVMVLDPPAFAKHLSAVNKAAIGYKNLNTEALKRISPNGILFTFSCSQAIDKKLFRQILFSSAVESGRNIRILHQLTQPQDHPVSIYHPEGEYLKGLVLHVE